VAVADDCRVFDWDAPNSGPTAGEGLAKLDALKGPAPADATLDAAPGARGGGGGFSAGGSGLGPSELSFNSAASVSEATATDDDFPSLVDAVDFVSASAAMYCLRLPTISSFGAFVVAPPWLAEDFSPGGSGGGFGGSLFGADLALDVLGSVGFVDLAFVDFESVDNCSGNANRGRSLSRFVDFGVAG